MSNEYDDLLQPQGKPVNEYDAVVVDFTKERDQRTRASLLSAQTANPDLTARALQLSKTTGIPVDTIERDPKAVEDQVAVNDYDALLKKNPKLGQWLSDPVNARVAKDDHVGLSAVEQAYRKLAQKKTPSESADWEANALPQPGGFVYGPMDKPDKSAPLWHSEIQTGVEDTARGIMLVEKVATLNALKEIDDIEKGVRPTAGPKSAFRSMSAEQREAVKQQLNARLIRVSAAGEQSKQYVAGLPVNPAVKTFQKAADAIDIGDFTNVLEVALDRVVRDITASRSLGDYMPEVEGPKAGPGASKFGALVDAFFADPLGLIQYGTTTNLPQLGAAVVAGAVAGPPGAAVAGVAADFPSRLDDVLADRVRDKLSTLDVPINLDDPQEVTRYLRDNPEIIADAVKSAGFGSLTVGLTEAFLNKVVKPLKAGKGVARNAGVAAANTGTGIATEMAGEAAARAAAGQDPSLSEVLMEGIGGAGTAAGHTAVATVKEAHEIRSDETRRENAKKTIKAIIDAADVLGTLRVEIAGNVADKLDDIIAKTADTKLAGRLPEKLVEFLSGLSADTNVFIPADVVHTYLQSKPIEDAQKQADALGLTEQLPEALARGGDVVIPLAKYVSEAGLSDAHKAWREDVRLEADGLSIRQAQEEARTKAERVKLAVDRFEKQLEAGIAEVDATTRVYEDMRDKLKTLGQYTNDAAEQQAALFAERYAARAARNPNQYADAWDAYSKAGPGKGLEIQTVLSDRVRAMPPDDLDLLLNSIRSGKVKPTGTDADANAKFANDRTELKAALDSMGLDTGKLTNAQIRKAIKEAVEKKKAGLTFDQPSDGRQGSLDGIASRFGLAGVVPATADERLSDSGRVAAKELAKLLVPKAKVAKSFGALDVKGRNRVLAVVRALLQESKVLDTVVRLVPVDVVNMLGGEKLAAQALLDNPAMLIDLLPADANDLVPSGVQAMDILAPSVALAAAKVQTGLARFDVSASDSLVAGGALDQTALQKITGNVPHPSEIGNLFDDSLAEIKSYEQEARGQISFTDNSTIISLFQSRDLSTLIHEAAGHLWLEELRFDATALGASDQIKADLKTTEDFLETRDDYVNRAIGAGLDTLKRAAEAPGASPRAKADYANVLALIDNTGGPVTQKQRAAFVEQMSAFWDTGDAPPAVSSVFASLKNTIKHEKFAQSAETYFMEGKSPSSELAAAFRSFKRWMIQIYKRLSAIGAPISPEMREVFDRLIATDEQIENAQTKQGLNPIFKDAKSAGMTKAEFEAYTARANAVVEEAEQRLLQKTMDTIRKQRTKEWKADERNVREEVTQEVMSESGQQALALLTKGEFPVGTTPEVLKGAKLSKESIVETYGDESILPLLPAGIYRDRASGPGVMSADELAPVLGLGSGKELIERLTQLEAEKRALAAKGDNRSPAKARIDEETAQRMRERYGDPLNDGTIEQEAMAAVHSDKQAALMATELRVLARKAGHTGTITLDDIQSWAEQTIADKMVRDGTRAEQYARAERDAGKKVERALMKGNFVEAFKAKQDQLVNLALYREAQKAAAEVESARKLMDRYATADTLKGMDQEYLEQIHQLLETYEFKRRSDTFLAERKSFEEWAIEQEAKGFEVVAPPRLDKGLFSVNYRDMTVDELRGLVDTVKQIAHLGRWKKEMLDGQKKRAFEEAKKEVIDAIEATPQRGVSRVDRGKTTLQKALGESGHWLKQADAIQLRLETMFEWLDGDKTGRGPLSRMIFQRFSGAQTKREDMRIELNKRQREAFERVPKEQRKTWADVVTVPELLTDGAPARLNRSNLIAIALNIGNDGNLDKLLRGEKWNEEAVRTVLNKHLSKEEWQFVQDTWDNIGSLWPEIEALERRVNGVAPPKIEAIEVETPYGKLKGGYYPAAYDRDASEAGRKIDLKKAQGLFDEAYSRATTRASATRKRTGFAAPIDLRLAVIGSHINDMTHDIAFREAIIDAYRMLSDEDVRNAIKRALGPEYAEQIEPGIKYIANEFAIDRTAQGGLDKALRWSRTNATIVGLGLRFTTMLSQLIGYSNTIQRLGVKDFTKGWAAFVRDPWETARTVRAKSGEMRHRADTLDRDIGMLLKKMEGRSSAKDDVVRLGFRGISLLDAAVTIPTWIGAYQQGLHKGMNDGEAVQYADKMVRDTQGATAAKDLAGIMRGGEPQRLLTMFGSYMSTLYQRQRGLVRDARNIRSTADAMDVLSQSFFLLIVPALMSAYVSGQGPEDDEDLAQWIARTLVANNLASIPVVRDFANVVSNKVGGKSSFGGSKLSPIQSMFDNVIHAGSDVIKILGGDDPSDTSVKAAFNTVGFLTGLPTGQVGATSQFLWDALVSGSQSPETLKDWMSGLAYGPERKPK